MENLENQNTGNNFEHRVVVAVRRPKMKRTEDSGKNNEEPTKKIEEFDIRHENSPLCDLGISSIDLHLKSQQLHYFWSEFDNIFSFFSTLKRDSIIWMCLGLFSLSVIVGVINRTKAIN